jgi:hypothetical protein
VLCACAVRVVVVAEEVVVVVVVFQAHRQNLEKTLLRHLPPPILPALRHLISLRLRRLMLWRKESVLTCPPMQQQPVR